MASEFKSDFLEMNILKRLKKFPATAGGFSVLLFLTYGLFLDYLNPFCARDLLGSERVQVLKAQRVSPNFVLKRKDGSVFEADIPTPYRGIGTRQYVTSDEENKKLLGCEADVLVGPVVADFKSEFRVFEISCSNAQVGYSRVADAYKKSGGSGWWAIKFFLIAGLVVLCFIFDKRRAK